MDRNPQEKGKEMKKILVLGTAAMVASAIVSRARSETPDDAVLAQAEENLARVMKRALQLRFSSPS